MAKKGQKRPKKAKKGIRKVLNYDKTVKKGLNFAFKWAELMQKDPLCNTTVTKQIFIS